jgi:hypothetical protein
MQLMLQATVCDGLALDPFAFEEDGLRPSEVDVSWGKIVEALVIAGMVVMRHEEPRPGVRGRRAGSSAQAGCGS